MDQGKVICSASLEKKKGKKKMKGTCIIINMALSNEQCYSALVVIMGEWWKLMDGK